MKWVDRRTNIQKLIDEKGIDSHVLADEIHISYSVLRKYASGKRPVSKFVCEALASFFNVSEDVISGKGSILTYSDLIDWNTIKNAVTNWGNLSPAIKSVIEGKFDELFSLIKELKEIKIVDCLYDFTEESSIFTTHQVYPLCIYIVFEDDSIGLVSLDEFDFNYRISNVQLIDNFESAKNFIRDLYTYEFDEDYDECFELYKIEYLIRKYNLYKFQTNLVKEFEMQKQLIFEEIY